MNVGVDVDDPGDTVLSSVATRPQATAEILFRSTVLAPLEDAEPGRATIVLIDANEEFRRWAAEALADVANIETQDRVDAALEFTRETVPDLVITDDRENGSDGVELTRLLRADERTSHIPVMLISANAHTERRVAAFEAGADDYLNKPIEVRELLAKASSILERFQELRKQFRERIVIQPAQICERSVDQRFLEKVTRTIENAIESTDFSVQDLGDAVAMSTSQLTRKLQALIGQSPARLIRRMRLQRAADLVAGNVGQISEICFQVGYSDQSHFSRSFKREFGVTPMEYRRQHGAASDE
jgi:YesN/AraC family two-component response regulator